MLLLVCKASLFSTNGLGNAPALHDDLVSTRGLLSEEQFGAAVAVGQVSPGPTGLWAVSLGYLVGGIGGALAALVGVTLPPLLVVVLERAWRRVRNAPAAAGFVRGLSLAAVAAFVLVLVRLLGGEGSDGSGGGVSAPSLLIALGALVLALTRRVPVLVVLLLAALTGVVLFR